tara:strand:- start:279 stop:776 length:498 start_codon:yes stop_codon:yes gene_type:complete
MIRTQLSLWEDKKQIILEREKVDMSTLRTLKTRTNAFDLLPKDTYFIHKTGGINPFKKDLGPIFPFVQHCNGRILNQVRLTNGKDAPYPHLIIKMGKINFKCFMHKITGLAFLQNDDWERKFIIDHLDDDIFNYLPHNLEWTTIGINNKRAYERGRNPGRWGRKK